MITGLLLLLAAGCIVYSILVVIAARDYKAQQTPPSIEFPHFSVLKPLSGLDDGLMANLRSFFAQTYPNYELLFATRAADDPALAVVERLREEFPSVPCRVLVVGESPYPNAKVHSLEQMMREARHEILVMSDSDVRVTPEMLTIAAAEFEAGADLSTCPYRATAGASLWSQLEAAGMNTEFLGGVLVARMLEGMRFALGPTILARKSVIEECGGWSELSEFLAEDFVLGQRAAALGRRVILSSYVIEHRIGSQDLDQNVAHRLRWNRSTRRSRPWGYTGQIFTNPLPIALLLLAWAPAFLVVALLAAAARFGAAYAASEYVLRAGLPAGKILIQDLLSFGFWIAGFFGDTIVWRGKTYRLLPDGRFEHSAAPPPAG